MSVAKSYQNYEIVKKPYENNNKFYVDIDFKGKIKTVRWYEEPMKKIRSVKEVLGFTKGYITIFKGDTYPLVDWFREEPKCRYHSWWGWYVVSEDELPQLPEGITPVQLRWEDVSIAGEDCLKCEADVRAAVDALIYEPSSSTWQGEVGDRIDRTLTVIKVTPLEDGYYGPSTFFLFKDEYDNEYCWTTGSKSLDLGATYEVRGTIKALQNYKGKKQTVLTRCRVG